MKRRSLLAELYLAVVLGCTAPAPPANEPPGDDSVNAALPTPPWANPGLPIAGVPPEYPNEWGHAENREKCALIAPRDPGSGESATPRAATFSGGWAVAYDLPGTRSAFGVAGTGALASEGSYADWPNERRWSDGSSVEYGLEGRTGPNNLAYLRIAGQECLYNVWSRLGQDHLEHLLDELRFVGSGGR
jgi:hypothetical protein